MISNQIRGGIEFMAPYFHQFSDVCNMEHVIAKKMYHQIDALYLPGDQNNKLENINCRYDRDNLILNICGERIMGDDIISIENYCFRFSANGDEAFEVYKVEESVKNDLCTDGTQLGWTLERERLRATCETNSLSADEYIKKTFAQKAKRFSRKKRGLSSIFGHVGGSGS